ncbi:DUF4435 domain-containing protein [Vibrio alginolyticus]|uniref:DUF4435 domain-containing protein n=1 Tax=Vibrio alginolyticus TaxID=663 RepID=UPI0023D812F5|nr:DUF4435 domain-containing protein [Vibrio alginolyticus]WEK79856.1 DUF4435 domain-containing protein [Vibrio alginolyticus]
MEIVKGSSVPVKSDYVGSSNCFTNSSGILVYVEGFEDISFWNKLFRQEGIPVKVQAYGNCNKANGKGTIVSAYEKKEIQLGKNLLVALDSDYDYLLENNTEIFSNEFSFQTYAFSIENIIWQPKHLGFICQDACNNTDYINPEVIMTGLKCWSKAVYPEFLRFLNSGADDDAFFNRVIDTLDPKDLSFSYASINFNSFEEEEFSQKMSEKGLEPYNVYLFVRGHDFADKIIPLCKNIIERVSEMVKSDLIDTHGEKSGQFIQEFYKKRREPDAVARGRDIRCNFALPRIMSDIKEFKSKNVTRFGSSFKQVIM